MRARFAVILPRNSMKVHDYESAADTVRRLMFIEKLQQEIDEALLSLEN